MPKMGRGGKRKRPTLKQLLAGLAVFVGTLSLICFLYLRSIINRIDERMGQLKTSRATEFYGNYPPFKLDQKYKLSQIKTVLDTQGFIENPSEENLIPGEFSWVQKNNPREMVLFRPEFEKAGRPLSGVKVSLLFEEVEGFWQLKEIHHIGSSELIAEFELPPKRIAAFFAGRIRTQNSVAMSDIPVSMRLAIMAIEDTQFLEHGGVSIKSTLRALWRDLLARKWVEGGSTITQQLMKNLFFSREKALSRKFKEALYAVVADSRYSKEDILEAYLNEVYLGQWGTHEIHGVSEGAHHYFNRNISEISLAQSATLAAIVQAPNALDPRRNPQNALTRRNRVLKRMLEADFILPAEYEIALGDPLTVVPADQSLEDIDYFLDMVMNSLPDSVKSRMESEPLTIYTSLNPFIQMASSAAVRANVERIVSSIKEVKKKEQKGFHLQSALIALDVNSCGVLAVQGGKSYRQTQFNRVLQGQRQPGSLLKPFVDLTAFSTTSGSEAITPLTLLEDKPFEWKYDAQTWAPKNYDNQFRGLVTARYALEQSLNVPTARLAEKVGVDQILDVLHRAGIRSALPAVPSISLGSADLTPMEVAEAYLTLARLGKRCQVRPFTSVFDENKNLLQELSENTEQTLPADASFQVVQVLKGVFTHGTAKYASSLNLPIANFAGKTGTTNEYRDAWFVGFSPDILVLVWVGYDEPEKTGLTGAAAALPAWIDIIRRINPYLSSQDFVAPEGVSVCEVEYPSEAERPAEYPREYQEYFKNGTEPSRRPCRSAK